MSDIIAGDSAPTNPTAPLVDADRLSEIKDLLRYESSIAFYSHRAKESMLLLVAEVERLQQREQTCRIEVLTEVADLLMEADETAASLLVDRLLEGGA